MIEEPRISSPESDISGVATSFPSSLFGLDDDYDDSGEQKKIFFSGSKPLGSENSKEKGVKSTPDAPYQSDYKTQKLAEKVKELSTQIDLLRKNPRKVVQITVYYDDSTFETFIPR